MMVDSAAGLPQSSPEVDGEAERADGREMVMALTADAHVEAELVPFSASNSVGEPVERKLERLRADREAHSRKQIWTKDPHGGPYRKVNANKGYDPLIQLPDGSERKAELGYERVRTGPTSNFVGNHMTQGAIDLVQAQLEPAPPPPLLPLLAGGTGGGVAREPPRLLHNSAAPEAAGGGLVCQLQRYRWEDAADCVRLEVPLADLELGSSGATLACTIQPDRLELTLAVSAGGAATGGSACVEVTAAGAGVRSCSHRLLLHPLHAAVVPGSCCCYLLGLPALECSSAAGGTDLDKAWTVQDRCTAVSNTSQQVACAAPVGEEGSQEAQQAQQHEQHQRHWSVSFAVPPGATAAVVQLAKADKQQAWEALQASLPVVARLPAGNESRPDLAALRKAVRQQLSRSKHPAPTACACTDDMAAPATPTTSGSPAAPSLPDDPTATCQAALAKAEALVAAGQHAMALEATAACLPWLAELPQWAGAAHVHALRGRCHGQLGGTRQAVGEYTAAIGLARAQGGQGGQGQQGGSAAWLCQLLLERAMLHEQQELVGPALEDVLEASRLQPQSPAAVLLAAERLRAACRRAERAQQSG